MTKEEIRKIVMHGNTGEYSHVIICCDTFDYEDYPVYIKYGEDIKTIIANYNDYNKMSKVMEVYNYNLDLEKQLNETRSYHIEPLKKTKQEIVKNKENPIKQDKFDNAISDNLKKAIEYATKMHKGQMRLTGDAYINHPLHVVQNVLKYKKSKNIETLLISACLHDTLEDTKATYYDIVQNFGPQVASLVLELTTDEDIKKILGKQQYLSIKMKNMSSWALVIKLCDRLDNTNDLLNCGDIQFKNRYINETIGIIDYLLKNAKLSKTHITIIEQIIYILLELNKGDNEKTTQLMEINKSCSRLKNSQNENDIFKKLIKIANNMDSNTKNIY
ncbi:MAG: bifunctional (p)ppGpp synthetase/guanosine-3',5'-bis(diphosphate) 3'-pyrophosphohydrolase [Bacilli bacterium]|nr:bifunctional (p)ppGpp synthetase/guanosine-3',5'-bis(diphosphate) 3'-pyrophosphohydrolase [Bacilli bacterium]